MQPPQTERCKVLSASAYPQCYDLLWLVHLETTNHAIKMGGINTMLQCYTFKIKLVTHIYFVWCLTTDLLVSHGIGRSEEGREHLHALQQHLIEVLEEVGIGQAPVPILNNVAPIHDLPKDVPEVIPRHLQTSPTMRRQH